MVEPEETGYLNTVCDGNAVIRGNFNFVKKTFLESILSIEAASTSKSQNVVENYFYEHANTYEVIAVNVLHVCHHKKLHFASEPLTEECSS